MKQTPDTFSAGTKKDQILSLYHSGIHDIEELAELADARSSYAASVLQQEGLIDGYFDLYTSTGQAMNVYSKFFRGRLGFKDEAAARRSIALIDRQYQAFAAAKDRAGQHHALMMAMTMFNRARWTGKVREADVFRAWLADRLASPLDAPSMAQAA